MTDMLPSLTKILIIDDDPDLLLLLNKMLKRIGADTVMAENGESGLALLKTQRFDLLVLDLMLPDIDGYEVLKRVRTDEALKNMPVLILSARADPNAINKGLEAGADGYLTKPYLPSTLTSRVRAILAEKQQAAKPLPAKPLVEPQTETAPVEPQVTKPPVEPQLVKPPVEKPQAETPQAAKPQAEKKD